MTAELVRTNGHLTITADQTFWTDDQKLVLQQTGIDGDVTRAELTGFLHLSQRTGLDPFSRQIYLIGRWDGRAQRKVYTPQTGIDGYRIVAQRTAERTGAELSYDDTLWCGEDGEWRDVWLSADAPRAAKVTVYRGPARFSAVATYAEYVQLKKGDEPTAMWKRMPAVMLAKCAESLALRKAFPHDLAGVYTAEEMGQADNPRGESAERPARRERPSAPSDDEWSTPSQQPGDASQGTAEPEYAEVVEDQHDSVMATSQQVDYLNEGLKIVRGAETVEARLTALSQILNRKLPEGYRLTRSDVETATAVLAEEDRQNAKLRAQDAAKAERAAKAEAKPEPATGAQLTLLNTLTSKQGITDRNVRLAFLAGFVKRPLTSSKDLTKAEASAIIDRLNAEEPTPDALSVREVLARRIRTSPTSSELADASEAVWKAAEAGDITQEQASGLIDLSMARENELAQPVGSAA